MRERRVPAFASERFQSADAEPPRLREKERVMASVFFFYFAAIIVTTSILVVAVRNPIYSALALLIMFFHVAGLYVTLHAEFLAAVQVIVYAGAILVLYLFVVMLLNLKQDERYHRQWPAAAGVGSILAVEAAMLTLLKGGT